MHIFEHCSIERLVGSAELFREADNINLIVIFFLQFHMKMMKKVCRIQFLSVLKNCSMHYAVESE